MSSVPPRDNRKILLWVLVGIGLLWLIMPSMWLFRTPSILHGCGPLGSGEFHVFPAFFWGFAGVGWALQILLALWVFLDAHRKGQNGLLWGLLVFFTSIIGLLVYLIVGNQIDRPVWNGAPPGTSPPPPPPPPSYAASPPGHACAECGRALRVDYRVCPYCGARQPVTCPGCLAVVEDDWRVCPHCARSLR